MADDCFPSVPTCDRCGRKHAREWTTKLDDGWAGDSCLTDAERAAYDRKRKDAAAGKTQATPVEHP